jgi:2-polyprenyl-3-methyl-5-hydroxy-6-metoxy-1,4-benzoquinol methylase
MGNIGHMTLVKDLREPARKFRLDDTEREGSLSTYFRKRRDVRLRNVIERLARPGGLRILDLGGSVAYWRRVGVDFLRTHGATVTVLNQLASELKEGGDDADLFATLVGDACELDFGDASFDLVHSNSVIEHVGDWARMKRFAAETRRVGRSYYVQTPNYWFPVDPHYYRAPMIHWMPRPLQAGLLARFPIAYAGALGSIDAAHEVIDGTRLLDRRQFVALFPDAEIAIERVAGLAKSLIAVRVA